MSAFSSALANLDDSLQTVYAELACLGAGLEVDDDKLSHNLTDARYQAAVLRDLIHADRPAAEWNSRQALERVVHELEVAAKTRRNQPRRTRLAELADELEAGTITHRSEARSTLLNELRDDAIAELRREASNPNSVKELPGPDAHLWLPWFCRLAEGAAPMQELRLNFPALERFAAEMGESYWIPSAEAENSAQSFDAAAPATTRDNDAWPGEAPAAPEPSLNEVTAAFLNASRTGSYENALALCYAAPGTRGEKPQNGSATASRSLPPTGEPPDADSLVDSVASAPHTKYCNSCGGTFPSDFRTCPFDNAELESIAVKQQKRSAGKNGRSGRSAAQSARKMADSRRVPSRQPVPQPAPPGAAPAPPPANSEAAESEMLRLKTVLVERNGGDGQSHASFTAVRPDNRRLIAAAAAIVFGVGLTAGFYLNFFNAGKLRTTVVEASAQVAGIETEKVPDAAIQRDVEQKLAELKGSSIQATVDNGVVTLVGHSPSQWDQLRAGSLATQTTGVKSVKNLVQVDTPPAAPAKGSRAS